MKVTAETLPERQVKLQIEVDETRHNQAVEDAYKKLAPKVRVPGFRPGKAPRQLIEKAMGRHRLLDEAMDMLLPKVYTEALEEQDIDPVAQPSVEIVSHEPLVFTATIPLKPITDLGDYHSLRVERPSAEVNEQQVEETIMDLRRRYGVIEPVDRPATLGDRVRANLLVEVDGERVYGQDDQEYPLREDFFALPEMLDAFLGAKKGDHIEKTVHVDEEFPDERIGGKDAVYKIDVHEVKEEKIAEENDEFAQQVGEGFTTMQALRDRIRDDIQKNAEDRAKAEHETAAIDALADLASIEYPAVMVEHEIEHILEDQANLDPRDPRAVELYLQRLNKSEEEVKASVREDAERRLRRSLVLSQFAEAENISVEDADIDAEIQTMASSAGEQADAIVQLFNNEGARESLSRSLLTRKTLARLTEIAGGEPAVEEKKAARRTAAPKARRSAPRKAEAEEGSEAEETEQEQK